jgi:aminopeptidase N
MRFLFLAFIFVVAAQVNAQSKIDVLHYRFHIELNDNNDTIYGQAEIKLRFLEATSSVDLDLVQSVNNSKGMVFINASGYRMHGYTSRNSGTLSLMLSQPAAKNDTATYTINYKGIPADGLIISKNKYGRRTFFADNWPDRGHNWLPCNDHPADKAPVEFIVTAPQHYQVVANGVQVEETNLPGNKKLTHWKEDVPVSTKVMVIGVADFAVQQSGMINNCIPVSSWVYPEDRNKGFHDYAQAAEILPWYIRQVGPYAYKKLANVQSKTTFGGLENANTIFYSENSVSGTRKSEGLIAHEIAHQWFGNMATEKTFAHLWLSEGFATYMTILYMENKYGIDTAKKMLREDRDQVISFARTSNRPVVDSAETDYMALLNANSYQKGGWILHMLRRELGDSVFWSSIRNYYAKYAGGIAGTDDLRAVFEKTSGKDLKQFFKQWLYTPGIPKLNITWSQLGENIEITVEQLQDIPYQFSLDIKIVAGETKIRRLDMSDKKQSFLVTVKQKATNIALDPEVSLLFSGAIKEVR